MKEDSGGKSVDPAYGLLPWVVGLVILLAAGIVANLASIRRLGDDAAWVDSSHEVAEAVANVRGRLREAEATQRTYLVTGAGDVWRDIDASVGAALAEIERVSEGGPYQTPLRERLDACSNEAIRFSELLKETSDLRRDQGLEAAQQAMLDGEAEAVLGELILELSAIESSALKASRDRLENRRDTYNQTLAIGLLSGLAGLAGLFAFLWLLQRHLQEHRARAHEVASRLAAANLMAAIVESSNDAIISKSISGVIQTWNRAAERLFGYTADEAIGQSITMLLPKERLHEEEDIIRRLKRGERIEHFETQRLRKDGSLVMVSLTISPVRDEQGKIVSASKIARDVTERARVESELRESEERFRMLADNISQFAWIADANGWISWYNQRWYDYTGTTFEEMQGWGWRAVHHPEYVDGVVERIQHAWDTGEVWEDLFPLRGRDGEYRWFLSRALPIRNERGEVVRWFGTNTDVTEQRNAEQALRDADERKNEFLAMLAHELRNPLAPVRYGIDLMSREERVDPESLGVVRSQVDQLVRLVDDLLDVSRIMRGKVKLRKEAVDLAEVLRCSAASIQQTLRSRDQHLAVSIPTEPIWMHADPVRLNQVVGNLLNNASKYSDPGTRIELTAERHGDRVRVSIRDQGVGIDKDLLPWVFDLFTQAAQSIDRSQGGLGIGLTIVKQLVELHGGSVAVHSDGVGRGSLFSFELPADAAAPEPTETATDPKPDTPVDVKPLRILVVDDNRGATWMLSKLLAKLGPHTIDTAHDGPAALEKMREQAPDLAFLDIGLPGMDGYEVAASLRADPPTSPPYLVALTGYSQQSDRDKAFDAGFNDYLVKPAGIDDLSAVLAGVSKQG